MENRDMQIHPMGKVFFFVEVSTHQISRDESWYFLHSDIFKFDSEKTWGPRCLWFRRITNTPLWLQTGQKSQISIVIFEHVQQRKRYFHEGCNFNFQHLDHHTGPKPKLTTQKTNKTHQKLPVENEQNTRSPV